MSNSKHRRENLARLQQREWYKSRAILGHTWARFFVFLGGRGAGKSTDIQRFLVKQWKEKGTSFTWCRLTDAELDKIKMDKCANAFEPVVVKQFPELNDLKLKGDNLYCQGKLLCEFKALSTFQNDKGTALYDCDDDNWSYILLDEMNKASGARRTGDPVLQFQNTLETILRTKGKKIKVFMIGNLEGLSSMMAGAFNWIPLDGNFGIYKLRKKKAVIHYFDDTEAFKEKKKNSTSQLIGSNHSTFTNVLTYDKELIVNKGRLMRPLEIIKFPDDVKYTVWLHQNGNYVICKFNPNDTKQCKKLTPMAPRLDAVYRQKERDRIKTAYDLRFYRFRNLATQEMFRNSLALLRSA